MFPKLDKKYFDRVFTSEDPWRYSVSEYERNKYLRQLEAISEFCPQPQSILEIGCAEGVFTAMLADVFPQTEITGVDISATAIARARDKHKALPNTEFIEADAIQFFLDDLLPKRRFDVIIQSASIHYIFVRLLFQRRIYSYLSGISNRLNNKNGIFVTSNEINIQTKFMLLICYSIMGRLCQPVRTVTYRGWSDFRKKHLSYDLRVFRTKHHLK